MAAVPKFEDLPDPLKKALDPEKEKARIMVAKGMAPLPAPLLVSAWVYLARSDNEEIVNAARESLKAYPENMLSNVIKSDLMPWVLASLGQLYKGKDAIIELILLNPKTPASLFEYLARDGSEVIAGIIANNQEKIIERPQIILALETNPHNLRSATDKLRQFLRLSGILIPGDTLEEEKSAVEEVKEDEKKEEPAAEEEEKKELTEDDFQSLLQFIAQLNTGGKMKLAFKGNKEARGILIKEPNKIVSTAVLKNPRITDNEVAHYAQLKNVSDEVVRLIAVNPQWTKAYPVKLGLVNNPKTPVQESMKFLKFLNMRDLKGIARSKTIPGPISKAAKQMLRQRMK